MTPVRNLRVRDAELSVRVANCLCKKFGEDVTMGVLFSDVTDNDLLNAGIGRKGLKEVREIIELARVNGHFEPQPPVGGSPITLRGMGGTKTLRDEFAMIADRNEFGELKYSHVSRTLAEKLLGRPYPTGNDTNADVQLERVKWDIELAAKLRFMFADAMMEARSK